MAFQKIPEAPVEALILDSVQLVRDSEKTLYDLLGYRGSFSTTTNVTENGVTEFARLDMVADDAVPVAVSVGDVILYRTTPALAVVGCISQAEFAAEYQVA